MKRPAALLLWFLLSVSFVLSQTAIVKRNLNLRSVPSTGGAPIVKVVLPPAQLELLDPNPTNGFYHVKARQNEGWVWGRNISIQLGDQPPSTTQPPPTAGAGSLIESNPLSAISSSWEKETPSDTVFHGDEGGCAETGDGGDTDTNKLKNRVDVPPAYRYVTWDAINSTLYPQGALRSRANCTQSQFDQITPVEGAAIAVEGYLYKVKVESSSASASSGGSLRTATLIWQTMSTGTCLLPRRTGEARMWPSLWRRRSCDSSIRIGQ
jgi:hypothetical protein